MHIYALRTTHIIQKNENLVEVIIEAFQANKKQIKENTIIVIAETPAGICEGRVFNLNEICEISEQAKQLAQEYQMDPRLVQRVIDEASDIMGGVPGLLLTVNKGILIANSGIDKSNAGGDNIYAMWPKDPFQTAKIVKENLQKHFNLKNLGIIISDSRVQPMKRGVIGVAIGVAGFEPLEDCRGRHDLYGNIMHHKVRAVADQLADAAHIVMGECDERTPFVVIEDAPVKYIDTPLPKNIMIMPKEQDLFVQILKRMDALKQKNHL